MPQLSELEMYKLKQPELVKKYEGKILALKCGEVQGVFESKVDALAEMKKKFLPGAFMIIKCTPGEDEYTRRYRSRVVLAHTVSAFLQNQAEMLHAHVGAEGNSKTAVENKKHHGPA